MAEEEILQPEEVHRFAREVLDALGMPDEDASIVADSMLWTALNGRITHSLIRLIMLADAARAGTLSLTTDWTPVRIWGATVVMDARSTWGMLAGARGMRHAIANAKKVGVGITSVRNCENTGALSWYTSLALDEQLIGMAISNTLPLMPLWGGARKLIGNQPMSFAVPAGERDPLVIDQMLAMERLNVLRDAARDGTQLPPGVIVDAAGRPTTAGSSYADGGAVLPMGKHRGGSLALMFEVLTGLLAGGLMLDEIGVPSEKYGASLYLMVIAPAAFADSVEDFLARVDRLIDRVHAAQPAPGVERVRVPGDERAALARQRAQDGIPFAADDVERLHKFAAELGVPWPSDAR
ncbi:MAG TPA: Ldh family oxidoreductase [Jatrophihabitans sp.]|nr:Ldh family oxidoreductase [Jatrophihabitans sp.]